MSERLTVDEYLRTPETLYPHELTYGYVREAASPGFFHQLTVGRLYRHIANHVEETSAGIVVVSPMDVILDRQRALVVQPDLMFVAAERASICTDRIWGAPDLTIEVLSPGNPQHDRTRKVRWYRHYGVRECWLVDLAGWTIEVLDLQTVSCARLFVNEDVVRSGVLPGLAIRACEAFEG